MLQGLSDVFGVCGLFDRREQVEFGNADQDGGIRGGIWSRFVDEGFICGKVVDDSPGDMVVVLEVFCGRLVVIEFFKSLVVKSYEAEHQDVEAAQHADDEVFDHLKCICLGVNNIAVPALFASGLHEVFIFSSFIVVLCFSHVLSARECSFLMAKKNQKTIGGFKTVLIIFFLYRHPSCLLLPPSKILAGSPPPRDG